MELNDPRRLYVIGGVAALLVGMWAWKTHLDTVITQADGQVKELKQQASLLKEQALQKNKELVAANFRFEALEREARRLAGIAHRLPTPPDPPAAPETAEELTLSMRVALSPTALAVEDLNAQTLLSKPDAQKVFLYFEEAQRVPLFEQKTKAQEEAIVSLEAAVTAAGDRYALQGEALSLAGTQNENCNRQNAILAKEVSQTKTKGRLEKILWGAAGVGVGFLAARR